MPRLMIASLLTLVFCLAVRSAVAQVSDVVTLDTGAGSPGATVDIPVYIRDVSGSPLGLDQPSGSRIQAYSIKVDYSPAASIQSVTFARAGVIASLTPTFETSPTSPGSISAIATFQESTNLIPFTLNAAAPGDQIGVLHFIIAVGAVAGTVSLTLDPTLTQLSNEGGTLNETVTATDLTLVNGSITVSGTPVQLQSFDVQ